MLKLWYRTSVKMNLNLRCGQSPSGPGRKGYGHVKRKVLRWRLKLSNDGEYLIGRGISFHIWGEAGEKA